MFNDVYIFDNKFIKKAKNEYGADKLANEKLFYSYIIKNKIPFNIPKIYTDENIINKFPGTDILILEYLKDRVPFYKCFCSDKLKRIYYHLSTLHSFRIKVTRETFFADLNIEMYEKIKSRFSVVRPFIDKSIKKVNGLNIPDFDKAVQFLYDKIKEYYNQENISYEYSLIHGDCQFNNILVKHTTALDEDDTVFIDPRGYYGNSKVYGLKEYDYAKVLFAITGYDEFDNSKIQSLDIDNDNINLHIQPLLPDPLTKSIESYITISIWMGNSHCFINDKNKMLTSYYYSLYLFSKLFPDECT